MAVDWGFIFRKCAYPFPPVFLLGKVMHTREVDLNHFCEELMAADVDSLLRTSSKIAKVTDSKARAVATWWLSSHHFSLLYFQDFSPLSEWPIAMGPLLLASSKRVLKHNNI